VPTTNAASQLNEVDYMTMRFEQDAGGELQPDLALDSAPVW